MLLKVGVEMRLKEYMLETFPNLELRPPLFYNGDIGIRFKLGVNYDCTNIYENCPYLEGVYNRAITLFQSLHSKTDDMYIVVDVNDYADGETFKHKLNIFSKYVKRSLICLSYRKIQSLMFFQKTMKTGYIKHIDIL